MASFKLMCAVVLLMAVALPLTAEAIDCSLVMGKVSGCIPYLRNQTPKPTSACCSGVSSLKNAAKSTPDRQAVCGCLNLRSMFGLKVPVVSIVIGEGGSGGALAIGCANKLLMLEIAVFYVASPEACAAILWKSAKASPKAAEKLKITVNELCKLQIADGVIPELGMMDAQELITHRMLKFRKIGGFQEGIPKDPKMKVDMKKDEPMVGKTSLNELKSKVEQVNKNILKESSEKNKKTAALMSEINKKFAEIVSRSDII